MPVVKSSLGSSFKRAVVKKPAGLIWSGPCGDGPHGGVTQSLLVRFLRCRERFRLYVVDGWRVTGFNPKMEFGNLWHLCEEYHAKGKDWKSPLALYASNLAMKYRLQQDEIKKWYGVVLTQFPVYVSHWQLHPHVVDRKPICSEKVFDVPYKLPSGQTVRLRGKFDSVDQVKNGVWLMENKTKSRIDEGRLERRLSFDIQTMLYLIALAEARITKLPIIGVRYNVIRRDCPIKPHQARSNKTKKTFTPAETDGEFFDRLRRDYFEADPGDWFFRWEVGVSSADVNRFKREFLDPCLEDVCRWWALMGECNGKPFSDATPIGHYRTPYGAGIVDDYDDYAPMLETGSTVGYERVSTLFPELE